MRPRVQLLTVAAPWMAVAAAFAFASPVFAQSIEDAREHWFDADFEAARREFEAVLASERLTVAQAKDAHRYLAVLHMLLGNDERSRGHADAAVALDLEVTPPEGSPPTARDVFRMARRRLGGRAATLSIEAPRALRLHAPGRVIARLEPSPPRLIGELRLRCGNDEARSEPPNVELRVEPDSRVVCSVDALSSGGAPLLTLDRELPIEGHDGTLLGDDSIDSGERERKAWPWAVGISAGVLAVAGVVVAVLVLRSDDGARFGTATVVGW